MQHEGLLMLVSTVADQDKGRLLQRKMPQAQGHMQTGLNQPRDLTRFPVVGLDLLAPLAANWQTFCFLSLSQIDGCFNTWLPSILPTHHPNNSPA